MSLRCLLDIIYIFIYFSSRNV